MEIFGWIMLIILMLFGLSILVIYALPYIISDLKSIKYKAKKMTEDKKLDVDKRSDEKRRRDEIKRQKDFELANKKLDSKLQKVNKQIEIQEKKLALVKELKNNTDEEKKVLIKEEKETKEISETKKEKPEE